MIVAEAPGKTEDQKGKQLVGVSGRYLKEVLDEFGVSMRRDCIITNSIICRPPDNRTPSDSELDYCYPNFAKALAEHQPEVIIPLGAPAVKQVLTDIWKQEIGSIGRWVGWEIPCQQLNAWIVPNWHPAYILREVEAGKNEVAEKLFRKYLKRACDLEGRPWNPVPKYEDQIEIIMSPRLAAKIIRKWTRLGGEFGFDYETNMLKPDSKKARIVCCSVCRNGKRTIAFPWMGEVVEAMGEFLQSKWPKTGHNIKFEDRWSKTVFGKHVRNWKLDTMILCHVLDNRPWIASLKFQSFIHFGVSDYSSHISSFLEADESNLPNRIHEVDLRSLLLYCGMDSLLEFKLAEWLSTQVEGFKIGATNA